MAILDVIRFEGALSGHGSTHPVGFTAMVDDDGLLQLVLDPLPYSREAHDLFHSPEPTEPLDYITLEGVAADGTHFHSNAFGILHFGHGSTEGRELDFQGYCSTADIIRTPTQPRDQSSRLWLFRKLSTIHRLAHDHPFGRVVIGGTDRSADSQRPDGFLHVMHPSGEADEAWWEESERFLLHVSRVLSLACDSYLLPVIERHFHGTEDRLRIVRRGRAGAPYMAPFSFLHMGPIFTHACASYPALRDQIAEVDPAIRWLTAPITSGESRLINAVTALENILDRSAGARSRKFLSDRVFKRMAGPIKNMLIEGKAPPGMIDKLLELNRRSFREQVEALLGERGIVTDDFPDDWLEKVVSARNSIIHRGIVASDEEDRAALDRIIWAREIVTRLLLHRFGYEGNYQSWLHRDVPVHFPSQLVSKASTQ